MIIAIAAALVSYLVFQSALGILGLFLIPPAAAYGWLCYRDAGWAFEEDRLVVCHRSLGRKTAIAPRGHLQSRGMVSSPFQRRVRLATFLAEVASGSGGSVLRVKDLDGGAARALVDDLGPEVRLEGG
jgi:putative membrane protein